MSQRPMRERAPPRAGRARPGRSGRVAAGRRGPARAERGCRLRAGAGPAARAALAVALALLLAGGALAAHSQPAAAETGEAAGPAPASTTLHPGWNMVAWLGPGTEATDLFDAIPELEIAFAWDTPSQRYRRLSRESAPRSGLTWLTPGMGLWLRLGGGAAVEWTQPLPPDRLLLSLHDGLNLVGWSGDDGAPVAEALARFGGTLVRASRWDASSQAYVRYRPGAPAAENTLAALDRGDALWVELTAGARWWQSRAATVHYAFPDDVTAEQEAGIRSGVADTVAFFAERYGVWEPDLQVLFDPDLRHRAAASPRTVWIRNPIGPWQYEDLLSSTLAHEYFHVLQSQLRQGGPAAGPSPTWMTEGTATFGAGLYEREREGLDAELLHLRHWRRGLGVTRPLAEYEDSATFYNERGANYYLGALAVEWLTGHAASGAGGTFGPADAAWTSRLADGGSHVRYYGLLSSSIQWHDAFEAAFRLAPDVFYVRFESYLQALARAFLPHLADDVDTPVVAVSGPAAAEQVAAVRDELSRVQSFFAERFGAPPADYTVHLAGDDESAAATGRRLFGAESDGRFCGHASLGLAARLVNLSCTHSAPNFWSYHLRLILEQLAPWGSLPPVEEGDRRGPWWLLRAIDAYVDDAYGEASGREALDELRSERRRLARGVEEPLSALATGEHANEAGYWSARALSFVAGEWLASHAGEPALLDYYRQLPSAAGWEEAFEAAFGLAVGEFHSSFEEHRAGAVPALPRLRGRVLGPDGEPAVGVEVRAIPRDGQPRRSAETSADGTFAMGAYAGRFLLEIHADSPGGRQDIGWYGPDDGFSLVRSRAHVVEVADDDIAGITIRIPEIDWRRIEGVLRGPGGEPVSGVYVDAYPTGDYPGPWDQTDEQGRFTMYAAGGTFRLDLYADSPGGRQRLGFYAVGDGFSPLYRDVETVDVEDRDATGIVINLPVSAVSEWYELEGVVLGPGGEPVADVHVNAHPVGEHPGSQHRTDGEGRFRMFVLGGSFELHLSYQFPDGTRRIGFYGEGDGFAATDEQPGIIHVRGQDLTGVVIRLPFDPAASE